MKRIFIILFIFISLKSFSVYHRIGGIEILSYSILQIEVHQDIAYTLETQSFKIYDISDITNPILLNELNIDGYAQHMSIQGNYAYISAFTSGYQVGCFFIVELNDANNLTIVYEYFTYLSNGYYAPTKSFIKNDFAYVTFYDPSTWDSKLRIFDISEPQNTTLEGTLFHSMEVLELTVNNDFCYLFGWGQGYCLVVDVSDKSNPTIATTYYDFPVVRAIKLIDNIGYCCCGISFKIYDFSDPYTLSLIGECGGVYQTKSIDIYGNKEFIAAGSGGLKVFDITNIEEPYLIDVYDSNNSSNSSAIQVTAYNNDIAFLTDTSNCGFLFIDTSDSYNSHLINHYNYNCYENRISSYDNILVFVDNETIYFFDITDTYNPIQLYSHSAAGYLQVVYATQDYVFVTLMQDILNRLYVYDISNPDNIHLVGSCNTASSCLVRAMSLNDNFLYLATGDNQGVIIYEISPNNDPVFVTCYDEYHTLTIEIQDDIAYISTITGLGILDVSDPNNVFLLNEWQTPDYIKSILIKGNVLYLLLYDNKLYLVDIIDIYNPIILSDILPYSSSAISPNYVVEENELIFSDLNWNELFVYDVSNPEEPVLDSSLRWNLKTVDLIVYDNCIITANRIYGLSFLEMTNFTNTQDNIIDIMSLNVNNYPNPFNPETTVSFSVTQTSSFVTLEIYNIKGQKVKTLVNEVLPAGVHSTIWNGRDDNGNRVGSGIYFYKLSTKDETITKKMLMLK